MWDFIFMADLRQISSHMIGNVTYIRVWDWLRTVTTFFHCINVGGNTNRVVATYYPCIYRLIRAYTTTLVGLIPGTCGIKPWLQICPYRQKCSHDLFPLDTRILYNAQFDSMNCKKIWTSFVEKNINKWITFLEPFKLFIRILAIVIFFYLTIV